MATMTITYSLQDVLKFLRSKNFKITKVWEEDEDGLTDPMVEIGKYSVQIGEGYLCVDENFEDGCLEHGVYSKLSQVESKLLQLGALKHA